MLWQTDESGEICLSRDARTNSILPILTHWSSQASEIKLIPPPVFDKVTDLINTRLVNSLPISKIDIGLYGDALHLLLMHDQWERVGDSTADNSSKEKISQHLSELLSRSMELCRASIACKSGPVVSLAWESEWTEFEEMVRTGVYAPHHPVIRRLPYFRQDRIAERSKVRTRAAADQQRRQEDAEVLDYLTSQSGTVGVTCNKYKTKHRALTPGIFTVFCAGCGMCEAFEIMMCAESPLTPFRMFAHRAWRKSDFDALKKFQGDGVWQDCV